jgi:hypothetical protein
MEAFRGQERLPLSNSSLSNAAVIPERRSNAPATRRGNIGGKLFT